MCATHIGAHVGSDTPCILLHVMVWVIGCMSDSTDWFRSYEEVLELQGVREPEELLELQSLEELQSLGVRGGMGDVGGTGAVGAMGVAGATIVMGGTGRHIYIYGLINAYYG